MAVRPAQTQAVSMILMTGIVLAMLAATYNWGAPLVEKSQTNSKIFNAQQLMSVLKQRISDVALSGAQKSFQVSLDGTLEVLPDKNSVLYSVHTKGLGVGSLSYISLDSSYDAIQYETYAVKATDGGPLTIAGKDYDVDSCTADDLVNINGTAHNSGDALAWDSNYVIDHVDCTGAFDEFTVITGPEKVVVGLLGSDAPGVLMAKTLTGSTDYLTRMRLVYRELDDSATFEGHKIIIHSEGNSLASSGDHTITIRRANIERIPFASNFGGDLVLTHVYISIS